MKKIFVDKYGLAIKKTVLCCLFFLLTPAVLFLILIFYGGDISGIGRILGDSDASLRFSPEVYSFLPEEKKTVTSEIKPKEAVEVMIEKYLRRYNSPLLPYIDNILQVSFQHGVDPKLIVAIAQQESNLGKSSPEDCFNAWGWGIHARGTTCFDSWPEAIETVTAGIAKSYCTKGLCEDPCVMMKKYTPKSNGSWCFGVNQFLNEMETGDF